MNRKAILQLACLIILSLFVFNANAEGLSEYLQNPEATKTSLEAKTSTIFSNDASTLNGSKDSTQLKNIIELVVAGIVAAALIIVVLVIFLGRWLAGREKKLIKELRMEAEENSDHISSAASTIREQEKETTQITQSMRNQSSKLELQQKETEHYSKKIAESSKKVKQYEKDLGTVSDKVSENMTKIQKYWDGQVNETVDTISLFQHSLKENINVATEELDKINEQKTISDELLQEVLNKHNEQNLHIDNNTELSDKLTENLEQAFVESNKLLDLLKKQQEQAESSLNEYSERLNNFEEQAYEQFDTSFQVADLARQELSANLDENRKHIETMRRQEEQSHSLNSQITKNLETLDYSKIVKISETLDTTQNMFDDIHHKVEETRHMLDELKQIEEDIKTTASNVESATKTQSLFDQQDAEIDKQIDELLENAENELKKQSKLSEDLPNDETELEAKALNADSEKAISEKIKEEVDALENPSEKIRGNTTVAITDYKMASGDSSTPLSFFRDIKKNSSNQK